MIKKAAEEINNKICDPRLNNLEEPKLPLIHKLSCLERKGCRSFYVALKSREWAKLGTKNDENRWHVELGTIFSIDSWNKIWRINKYALVSNKMKWINLQLLKHLLPTNYTVNKYKPTQDPRCSFCTDHLERLQDFAWNCPVVREFWEMVGNFISTYFPNFRLGRKEAIFGDINSKGDSVINTLILLAKQFLWRQKFGSKKLDELQYIMFMRRELPLLEKLLEFKGNDSFCKEWVPIFQYFEID